MTFEQWRDEFRAFQDGFVAWKQERHADKPVTHALIQWYRVDNYDPQDTFYDTLVEQLWCKISTR